MRFVIPGGTGQLGQVLTRVLERHGHEVVIIGRSVSDPALRWDGRSDGPWMAAIDGADAVVNLAGRSVNCRYHWDNLNEMMTSRVDSALAVGRAITQAGQPPKVWLQASTASIYAHHTDGPAHTEATGVLGGHEPNVPAYWSYSVHIARAWELALAASDTPHTRKVALRTGFTMSPDPGGIFDWLAWLVASGLGGAFCGGEQHVSWITGEDWARAILFLAEQGDISGPVNLTAPHPLSNRDFMARLRAEMNTRVALPIAPWMAEIGAVFLKTDTELMKKSRRVLPEVLLDAGFSFTHPTWDVAAPVLVAQHSQPIPQELA